jgi:hypothetical protein
VVSVADSGELDEDDGDMGEFTVDLMEVELPRNIDKGLPTQLRVPELRAMLAAIRNAEPDESDVFVEGDSSTGVAGGTTATLDCIADEDDIEEAAARYQATVTRRRVEDPYERKPVELLPLSTENIMTYPQENQAYFSKKQYVRKDKYDLAKFSEDHSITFPTVMEAFS